MKKITILICSLFLICSNILFAQHFKKDGTPDRRFKENKITSIYSTSPSWNSTSTTFPKYSSHPNYSFVPRDSKGRIKRSSAAKYEFKKETGYPRGRPGYVIDHIRPLKRGGCDCPSNMQWQTKAEAKAKDKIE
jgi:hypothetical protein